MTKKVNKIFVFIFIMLVFTLFFSMLAGRMLYAIRRIARVDTISIEWEKMYPYDLDISELYQGDTSTGGEELSAKETVISDSIITKLANSELIKIAVKIGTIGDSWSDFLFNNRGIAKIGYCINAMIRDSSVTQNVTKLKNGYLTEISTTKTDFESAKESLLNYSYLQKYLETEGIDFLFCYAPNKECALDNQLPRGVISYANDNVDTYIEAMEALGINYIDFRKKLHEDGLEHYSLFYKTDNHWNIDAGFWAASVIEKELNERFDLNIEDVNTFGTFSRKTFKNATFGTAGQTVGHLFAQSEDFDILFPDFPNEFLLEIPDKNINVTGSFEDIFIDYTDLNIVIEEGGGYAFETILYGNRPYVKITNLNNPDGPKILMIRDSFSLVVAPYLVFSCSELVLLDTRVFDGSVVNCIDGFKPDVVLALQCKPREFKLNAE